MAEADEHVNDETLDAVLEGSLGQLARDALERHLDGCTTCRRLVSDILRTETLAHAETIDHHDVAPVSLTRGDTLAP